MHLSNFVPATVHYRAWAESTRHKFDDTWLEQQPLEMVLGKGIYLHDYFLKYLLCFVKAFIFIFFQLVFVCLGSGHYVYLSQWAALMKPVVEFTIFINSILV